MSEVICTEGNLLQWWKLNQQKCTEQYRFSVHYYFFIGNKKYLYQ